MASIWKKIETWLAGNNVLFITSQFINQQVSWHLKMVCLELKLKQAICQIFKMIMIVQIV